MKRLLLALVLAMVAVLSLPSVASAQVDSQAHAHHEQVAPAAPVVATTTWGPTILGAPTIPAVLRGLGVGSLTALAGLLFFIVSFRPDRVDRPMHVALWLSTLATLMLAGHLGAWLVNAAPNHRFTVEWLAATFESTAGRLELTRTLLVLLPLWALALTRRPALALGLTLPALFVSAAIGHAAAVRPMWSIPLEALHLVALAGWLGGLLWLVVREPTDVMRFARETIRVSSVALAAVVAIGLSGVLQSVVLVTSFEELRSPYGVVLMLKVAGLGAMMAFGAYHRFRIVPRLAMGVEGAIVTDFHAALKRDVALLWLIAVLSGLLAYIPPVGAAS